MRPPVDPSIRFGFNAELESSASVRPMAVSPLMVPLTLQSAVSLSLPLMECCRRSR